jgi:hypothetical protein
MHQLQTRLEAPKQRTQTVERQLRGWRSPGGPMKRAAADLLAAAVFLTGLLLAAPAGAQRPHLPLPNPGPLELKGYCDFTVDITWTEFNQYVIQQTTAPDSTTTLKVTGHAQATVTNRTTSESVSYNVSGPGTAVFYPDGGFSFDAAGPNLFWTLPELSYPGVPTISYTTGHVTFTVAASGQTTSYDLRGARPTCVRY